MLWANDGLLTLGCPPLGNRTPWTRGPVNGWLRRRWRRAGAHGACPLRRWALLTVRAMEVLVTPYGAVLPSPWQVDPVRANVAWLPVRVIELLSVEWRSSEDLSLPRSDMLRHRPRAYRPGGADPRQAATTTSSAASAPHLCGISTAPSTEAAVGLVYAIARRTTAACLGSLASASCRGASPVPDTERAVSLAHCPSWCAASRRNHAAINAATTERLVEGENGVHLGARHQMEESLIGHTERRLHVHAL